MKRTVFWILLIVVAAAFCGRVTVSVVNRSKHKLHLIRSGLERRAAAVYLDSLYNRYLREDVKGARAAMIEGCVYIKKSPIPELKTALFLGYCRLSVLEERAGNPKEAEMYYERAIRLSKDRDGFTREECTRIVTHWDETYTKQAGPRYLQLLNEVKEKKAVEAR